MCLPDKISPKFNPSIGLNSKFQYDSIEKLSLYYICGAAVFAILYGRRYRNGKAITTTKFCDDCHTEMDPDQWLSNKTQQSVKTKNSK